MRVSAAHVTALLVGVIAQSACSGEITPRGDAMADHRPWGVDAAIWRDDVQLWPGLEAGSDTESTSTLDASDAAPPDAAAADASADTVAPDSDAGDPPSPMDASAADALGSDSCVPGQILLRGTRREVCAGPCPAVGPNIISKGNEYAEPQYDATNWPVLVRYLTRHGQSWISLRVVWERMQPSSRAAFNQPLVERYVRLVNSAHDAGLSVMLDFHTLMHAPYSCPKWLCEPARCRDGGGGASGDTSRCMGYYLGVATDSWARDAYVNFLTGVISRLKRANGDRLPVGLRAIALMNEPWAFGDWHSAAGREQLVVTRGRLETLFERLASTVRKVAPDVPLGLRFTINNNPYAENPINRFSPSILDRIDFVGLNNYKPASTYPSGEWSVFESAVADLRRRGLGVWVTEFGKADGQLADKHAYFQRVLRERFSGSLRPDVTLAWDWQSSAPIGEGFNVYNGLEEPARTGPFAALAAHGAACKQRLSDR